MTKRQKRNIIGQVRQIEVQALTNQNASAVSLIITSTDNEGMEPEEVYDAVVQYFEYKAMQEFDTSGMDPN